LNILYFFLEYEIIKLEDVESTYTIEVSFTSYSQSIA